MFFDKIVEFNPENYSKKEYDLSEFNLDRNMGFLVNESE